MRWLAIVAALAAAQVAHAAPGGLTASQVELEAGQTYLRGLAELARADASWDHAHPPVLFEGVQRAVEQAALEVQQLRLAEPRASALSEAADHLADAESDLRALAAPVRGLTLPPEERERAVARLQASVAAAQDALARAHGSLAER